MKFLYTKCSIFIAPTPKIIEYPKLNFNDPFLESVLESLSWGWYVWYFYVLLGEERISWNSLVAVYFATMSDLIFFAERPLLPARIPTWQVPLPSISPCGGVPQVFNVAWWMRHFGSPTPKRSKAYSNSKVIGKLNQGRLKRADAYVPPEDRTTDQYTDQAGRKRYKGSKKLKSSQHLAF